MAEHLSQSELDYPFKLLEYFNGFRISKVGVGCLFYPQNFCSLVNRSQHPAAPSLNKSLLI